LEPYLASKTIPEMKDIIALHTIQELQAVDTKYRRDKHPRRNARPKRMFGGVCVDGCF